jgi:USP6 N-terminal-like protein
MATSSVSATREHENFQRIEADRLELNTAYDNGYNDEDPNPLNWSVKTRNKSLNQGGTIEGTIEEDLNKMAENIDRYGFIHDTKLPEELTEIERKRNNIEKFREHKWVSMLKEWQRHYSPVTHKFSDKLVSRVYKGIPNSMRNVAWFKLLDIDNQLKAQTGVYDKMKKLAREYSIDLRQIDLDINRTFRDNVAYRLRYNQRQAQLYNVLAAYSIYNTEVGYCQGMSNLTAFFLLYFADEERTFWALSQLMSNSKYSMHGFFKKDFPKLVRYSEKHDMIIKKLLPKVHNKFLKCNITSLLYTTKWFLQCFIDTLPFSLVLRIWDIYLLKGDIAMLGMSYCILRMHKRRLLDPKFDMDKINEFLKNKIPKDFMFSDDVVMDKLHICIDQLERLRFKDGTSVIDTIPTNELPVLPFGEFKKVNKTEILAQLEAKLAESNGTTANRESKINTMAKERLEEQQKKRREEMLERRKRRRQEAKEKGITITNNIYNGVNGDENDDDDDLDGLDDDSDYMDDDDDDDLNPSKISDNDDDKYDKESMLSYITTPSQKQSMNDLYFQNQNNSSNSQSNVSNSIGIKTPDQRQKRRGNYYF